MRETDGDPERTSEQGVRREGDRQARKPREREREGGERKEAHEACVVYYITDGAVLRFGPRWGAGGG